MGCKVNKTVRDYKTNQQKNLKIKNNAILKILIRLTIKNRVFHSICAIFAVRNPNMLGL